MPASTRLPTRPSRLRRTVTGGSVLGVGLLVAATAGAPAALADPEVGAGPDSSTDQPDEEQTPEVLNEETPTVPDVDDYSDISPITPMFGMGKLLNDEGDTTTLTVEPTGDAPPDLSLAGARFDLTQIVRDENGTNVGIPAGVCVADDTGTCTITADIDNSQQPDELPEQSALTVPMGTYVLTQSAAPVGLAPVARRIVLDLCSAANARFFLSCAGAPSVLPVDNGSLFATEVDVQVQDAVTEDPISGAAYTLSGPDYPHAVVEDDGSGEEGDGEEGSSDEGDGLPVLVIPPPGIALGERAEPETITSYADPSDEDGLITFTGYFAPGSYSVDPDPEATPVPGYQPATSVAFAIDDTDPDSARSLYSVTALLSPVVDSDDPGGDGGTGDGPTTGGPTTGGPTTGGPTTGGPTTGGPTTGGPTTTGTTGGTTGGTTTGTTQRGTSTTTTTTADAAVDTAPVPAPPSSATRPSTPSPASSSSAGPQDVPEPTALETESSNLPEVGLIGFGVLFVAAVVVGIGVLRRRARARG